MASGLNIINRLYDNYGEVHWIDFNDIATYTDPILPNGGDSINQCAPRLGDISIVSGTYNKPILKTTNKTFIKFLGSNVLVATLNCLGSAITGGRSIYIVYRYTGHSSLSHASTLFYLGAFDLSNYIWSHKGLAGIGGDPIPQYVDYYPSFNGEVPTDDGTSVINYIFSSRDEEYKIQNTKIHTSSENESFLSSSPELISNNGISLSLSGTDLWLWLGAKPNTNVSDPDDGACFGSYDIGEVIIVSAYVSDQDDKNIISYLNNKWKDWI